MATEQTQHHASKPKGRVLQTFIPTRTFLGYNDEGELLANYKQGSTYYIREGNAMLMALANKWKEEGKIEFGE